MKKLKKISINCILITIFLSILTASVQADKVTLVGEVNDNQEIVADGQIYTVGDSAPGNDLVVNYISQRVKVVGKVVEKEEGKEIIVEFFEVVEE